MTAVRTSPGVLARSALAGFVTQLREAGLSPLAIVGSALSPVAYGVAVIAGYGRPDGALLLGCVGAGLWGSIYIQGTLIVVQERAQGTLQLLATSPSRISAPLVGRLLAAGCQSLAAAPVIAVVIGALFGGVKDFELPLFAAALVAVFAGLVGMSLLLMGALTRYRYSAGMVNGLFDVVVLLSGFFVPISALPLGIHGISSALPTSWAIAAVRPDVTHPWASVGIAGLLAAGWLALGALYLSGAGRRLRKIGFYQQ